jgi:hypothetical protein
VIDTLIINQLDFANTDLIIGARPLLSRGRRGSMGSANGGILLCGLCE